MKITISGKKEVIDTGVEKVTISNLLTLKNVEMPEMVSVELNGSIIAREDFSIREINDGDTVEFLYFMGGGS